MQNNMINAYSNFHCIKRFALKYYLLLSNPKMVKVLNQKCSFSRRKVNDQNSTTHTVSFGNDIPI